MGHLNTRRLILRIWHDDDLAPFAAINADPEVMRHFPKTLDRAESDAAATRIRDGFARRGFGLWAVEVPDVAPFIGFVGLSVPGFTAHFTPCVEIGWRLARAHWGKGYATEAALAVRNDGFTRVGLREIVSFAAVANAPSREVMRRIGMMHDATDDFDHPSLPQGHALRRHVLYRLGIDAWRKLT
jgi:RimJ/RimL family protein N-acetyltransferase